MVHVSQIDSGFNQLRSVPRLYVYYRACFAIDRVLSQPVEIALQMDPYLRGDVSFYYLVRMLHTRRVFLCRVLPRNSDYVIVGKYDVHYLDA